MDKKVQRQMGVIFWKLGIILFLIALFLARTPSSQPFSFVISILSAAVLVSGTILVSSPE